GTVCVVGKIRDLILQLSKSSIYSTKPFAPYIGVSWNQLYGKASDMAKREGEKDHQVVFLAGARIWF
uniref:copper resistance protein B n=1 Tax=Klebsiella pneumoniae TaxID=573 RepID=UPI003D181F2C